MASTGSQPESLNIQLLVDSIPALIHTARPDGYLDYFNRPWLEYLGATLDQVSGWNWKAFIHPEDVEGIVARWLACLASGEVFDYETRVRRADGEYRWMFHRKVPLRDGRGNIVKWYGSSMDIEERKRAEQAWQRNEFYLAEGQRLARTGSWGFNPSGSFDYWSPELFRIYGLDPAAGPPTLEQYLACVHSHDRTFVAETIKAIVSQGSGCDLKKRIVRRDGELRYIRCVGVPVLESGVLRRIIGTAMDVTEQEQLTQELQRREAYLAEAQRLSHTGSFGWKPGSGEIVWSDETYRIFEYEHGTGLTLDIALERVHPEDRALTREVIESATTAGRDFGLECRLLMPSGAIKCIHVQAHALKDPSANIEFVGAVTDITERKLAEEGLRQSEERFRLVLEGIGAHIIVTTLEGELEFANQPSLDYFGKTLEELKGWRNGDLLHPDDLASAIAVWERSIVEGVSYDVDHRFRRYDGVYRWFHVRGRPQHDAQGSIVRWYALLTDIDERKKAEQQLEEQEMELRQMLDLAPQCVAVYGPLGERLYANRILLDYLGLTLEQWRERASGGQLLHPDDRERRHALFDRASATGSSFELETRLRKNDGSYRWFLARYNPLRDEQGQITRWYVTGTDIEERRQVEDSLRKENVALREEIDKASMFEEIVGTSAPLKGVLSRISKVAPSDSTVLITGETGTGKELVARAIHRRSGRAPRAFVSVNCAAIPRDLIASELFGHEKGAFTGATQQRLGRFELASGGTIFLDEVGELPPETQVALLRVLQEHEFERVGGTRRIRTDVRVIAATNRDLQAAIRSGAFRSDLFYRLHVFPIRIPPLRERREDIPLLVEYFIDRYGRKAGKNIRDIGKKTLELLQSYPWPGNIRELQNIIERSVLLCETEIFSIDESSLLQQPSPPESKDPVQLPLKLVAQEKNLIEAALKESRGRVFGPAGAAVKLGIPRSTLESKIRSLRIDKNRFKTQAES